MAEVHVQFIEGLDEEISGISLRKKRSSSVKVVILKFEKLQALERGRSFTNKIDKLLLKDEEGEITVYPQGIKFLFRDDDELSQAECSFEVHSDEEFERVMRFLHRYAEEHGFEFKEN